MKWYYDQRVQKVSLKVGDKVLLNLRNYQTTGQKLTARYLKLFEIVEKLLLVIFKLKCPPRMIKIYSVFYASKLILYYNAEIPVQKGPEAQSEMVDGHKEWKIEKILSSRRYRCKL